MKPRLIKHNTNKGKKEIKRILATRNTSIPEDNDDYEFTEVIVTNTVNHRWEWDKEHRKYVHRWDVSQAKIRYDNLSELAGRRKAKKKGKPCRHTWGSSINKLQNRNCPYYSKSSATIVRQSGNSESPNYPALTNIKKG